ncbi:MAG TPA: carboxypeptidase-like regulatory domain-containing protein [Kofleriaceae bacterium]|nr:carboxypeptidase-like regulatory domain-containing protein [Kofleriaceae bacterium]
MKFRARAALFSALMWTAGAAGLVIAGALADAPAQAQIAAALGKPLPSPDLPVGTVSVRVVAGSAAAPEVGVDVTLLVNDTPRVARTDPAGRATFPGLPAGATVVAKVVDKDQAEHASEPFTVPTDGGTRVMITTKAWQAGAGAGGAPFAGGAGGGMPAPRALSGEARGEQQDPAGQLTVRVTYNDFKDTPAGIAVALVGYSADDSVSYQVIKTDKDGRAQFSNLDRSGGTSYFAMTILPRNGHDDRVSSMPVVLESQVGIRMVLSSEKRDSQAERIDDLAKADPQPELPAGKVRVSLEGLADTSSQVTLIDAATKQKLGDAKPQTTAPDPSRVRGGSQFTPDPKLPAGTLDVEVLGGAGQAEEPLKDIQVRVLAANAQDAEGGFASATGTDGTVRIAVPATEPQKAAFVINGKQLVSPPFDISKSGGKLAVRAQWEAAGRPEATFDLGDKVTSGQVVYAEAVFRGNHYRSMPFELLADKGTKISVYAFPRVLFRFQLHSAVDDELLAVQGKFTVMNYSWAPYRGGPDGLVIPLPKGFKGGVVFDPDQNEVSVAAGEGFRIVRPIPPGDRTFHGGFSLPVENGQTSWALDLPLGSYQSQMDMRLTPGMQVHAPANADGEVRTVPQGTFFVFENISIAPRQAMTMTIDGMPSRPAWRSLLSMIVGVLVVVVMVGGVVVALFFRRPASEKAVASAARRQRLLDELVVLERDGGNPKRREQVLDELEQLWS